MITITDMVVAKRYTIKDPSTKGCSPEKGPDNLSTKDTFTIPPKVYSCVEAWRN